MVAKTLSKACSVPSAALVSLTASAKAVLYCSIAINEVFWISPTLCPSSALATARAHSV